MIKAVGCGLFLNNHPYVFDEHRKVYRALTALSPKVVTMDQVKAGEFHASFHRAYVIGGAAYYYEEATSELVSVRDNAKRLQAADYSMLVEMGQVYCPVGDAFKLLVDRSLRRVPEPDCSAQEMDR